MLAGLMHPRLHDTFVRGPSWVAPRGQNLSMSERRDGGRPIDPSSAPARTFRPVKSIYRIYIDHAFMLVFFILFPLKKLVFFISLTIFSVVEL